MVEYHIHIEGIEAKDLGKELANTQYRYQGDVLGGLADKLVQESQNLSCPFRHSKLLLRTASGLYNVKMDLANAWIYCKNNKGNEKHPENVRGLTIEELAEDLSDDFAGYSYLLQVSQTLKSEFYIQAKNDANNKPQLASNLLFSFMHLDVPIERLMELESYYQNYMLLASSN